MRTMSGIVPWVAVASTVTAAGQALRPQIATRWQAHIEATEARASRERGKAMPSRPGEDPDGT